MCVILKDTWLLNMLPHYAHISDQKLNKTRWQTAEKLETGI